MSERFHDDDHYAKLKPQPIDVFRSWAETAGVPRRYLYSWQEAAYALIRAWLKNDDPRRDLRKASRMIAEIVEDIDKRKWSSPLSHLKQCNEMVDHLFSRNEILDNVPYKIDESYPCGGEFNIAVEDDSECPDCAGPGDGTCICFFPEPVEVKVDDGFRITWDGKREDKRIDYSTMSPLTRYLKDAIDLTDEQVLALEALDHGDVEFAVVYGAYPAPEEPENVIETPPEIDSEVVEALGVDAMTTEKTKSEIRAKMRAESLDQDPIPEDERRALVEQWVEANLGTVEYQHAVDHTQQVEDDKQPPIVKKLSDPKTNSRVWGRES